MPTFRYWMETEVHVYGFSIAANVLLAFYPFLTVLVSLCRAVHWKAAEQAIYFALNDYFPDNFFARNLSITVPYGGSIQIVSLLLLLFTANGIFEPLEVALNKIWGVKENRTFLRNQMVSMALIFACGILAIISVGLTAINSQYIATLTAAGGPSALGGLTDVLATLGFKLAAIPVSILMLFLVYWKLPNKRIDPGRVFPAAVVVGLVLEAAKYINLLLWPWFYHKLEHEYSVFRYSAALILWSFLASMIVLAGAEWSARGRRRA